MVRGSLHVFLGAAPGVGKTYAMLEEAHRLAGLGRDVVVAAVDTHRRPLTTSLLAGLPPVPPRETETGDASSGLDLDALMARRPDVALVDDLANAIPPGSEREQRWQLVEPLLTAGISVLSTVDIRHIESLTDAVENITGVRAEASVPDAVLRKADRVELVDLAPQALRDRLSAGLIHPASEIDAAVASYFRLGTLTALRELALLWLADEVDSDLSRYRADHGIRDRWETRERVVVALSGGPEGETLLRRGARIAARVGGGELIAVHVASEDGPQETDPRSLVQQRELVGRLGGTFHQIIGSTIPAALVDFARSVNATQVVVGASRRGRLLAFLTGAGTGATVIRASGDIDVHLVAHDAAAPQRLALPASRGALTSRRRVAGFLVTLVAGPLLSLLLTAIRTTDSLTADVLAYQLLVVVVALVGGALPAVFAAILSGLTLDVLFVAPLDQIAIAQPVHLVALLLYVINALLVSFVVDQAARRTRAARRAAAESEMLAGIAGGVIHGQDALHSLVARTREAFQLRGVRLRTDERVLAEDGDTTGSPAGTEASESAVLELFGTAPTPTDRRVLGVIAAQIDAAIEQATLAERANELQPLEETDRVRSALLAAVGHDLRRPLAVATAAVTGLHSAQGHLSENDRSELLGSAETALRDLDTLISDLLDVSRVQAGALAVSLSDVDVEDLLPGALEELRIPPGRVQLAIPADLPPIRADAILLQRAIVNLLANALRFSPAHVAPRVSASAFGDHAEIRIADHGPGVPAERRADLFQAFHRSGDTDNTTGVGLGLALSKGFVEGMGGTLSAEDTPGGGLTMVVRLPLQSLEEAAGSAGGHR